MRIGISISSSYRVEDPRLGARFMIERARVARQADLDSLPPEKQKEYQAFFEQTFANHEVSIRRLKEAASVQDDAG